jgi:hypothetical protein
MTIEEAFGRERLAEFERMYREDEEVRADLALRSTFFPLDSHDGRLSIMPEIENGHLSFTLCDEETLACKRIAEDTPSRRADGSLWDSETLAELTHPRTLAMTTEIEFPPQVVDLMACQNVGAYVAETDEDGYTPSVFVFDGGSDRDGITIEVRVPAARVLGVVEQYGRWHGHRARARASSEA